MFFLNVHYVTIEQLGYHVYHQDSAFMQLLHLTSYLLQELWYQQQLWWTNTRTWIYSCCVAGPLPANKFSVNKMFFFKQVRVLILQFLNDVVISQFLYIEKH